MSSLPLPGRIVIPLEASRPCLSVASSLAERLGAEVSTSAAPAPDALNVGSPAFAMQHAGVAQALAASSDDWPWDLIYETGEGGWIVTGSTPRGMVHAALALADWLKWEAAGCVVPEIAAKSRPVRALRRPTFRSLAMEFDDWSAGFHRMADGFDMRTHVQDAVRVGMTTLEVNLLADMVPVQVRERRVEADMYQWWSIYCAALDMFVESDLNRGTYTRDLLDQNLAKMHETVELARSWGLTPNFVAFEPRAWPERLYDKYPELRGARVDCSDYSAEPEYAPDVNHPLVLEHYAQMMTRLMEKIPDLGMLSIWSQDSCAGFPWAEKLYPGLNGPRPPRRKPIEETVTNFMTTLRDSGRAINPDLQVVLCASWFTDPEVGHIAPTLPTDIPMSYTVGWASDGKRTGAHRWEPVRPIRDSGREPIVMLEEISNPWKPLGPVQGVPFPWLAFDALRDAAEAGDAKDVVLRGGITSEAFVPNFINNEVIRAFQSEGTALDVDALIRSRAHCWAEGEAEAEALLSAWRLCDEVVRNYRVLSWTVTFISARTLWRRLVRPLVPNQKLLEYEDYSYYRQFEFNVGATDPAWYDHFFKGWGRMVSDDTVRDAYPNYDDVILPALRDATATVDACGEVSETVRDVRDRIRTLYHVLATERNLLEVQEAIHACLAESREHPERSMHSERMRAAIHREMDNTRKFIELLDASPSMLIPATSGEETTYLYGAPITHLLTRKLAAMERHLDDPPGPWFEELRQPGGWTSDLRDQL